MKSKSNYSKEVLHNDWGNGFVTMPRIIFDWMFGPDLATRQKGLLALFLWERCHYADSNITINGGHVVKCKRGEYIGTHREIAKKMGATVKGVKIMNESAVKSNLDKLKKEGLIEVERVNIDNKTYASRIRVLGYDRYNKPPSDSSAAKQKPCVVPPVGQTSPPEKKSGEAEGDWFDKLEERKKKEGRA